MANADHVGWLKDGHVTWNDRRNMVKFSPDLSELNFQEILSDTKPSKRSRNSFRNFNLSDANLRGSILRGVDFTNSSFKNADLSAADLSGGYFIGANFNYANMSNAVAIDADFTKARFIGTTLSKAILVGAKFFSAHIDLAALPSSIATEDSVSGLAPSLDLFEDLIISERKLLHREGAPSPKSHEPTYLVLYATNRKPITIDNQLGFGSERDKALNYGSCQVHVPASHKIGSLGSPFWKRLFRGDDRLKIRKLVELNSDLHWKMVLDNFSNMPGSSPPTVLIHGYKTDFKDAVLWAAQIGSDLGLRRGVSLFSWPSQGKFAAYTSDEAAVEASKHYLVQYLLEYMEHAGEAGINVLAHSMGCRCLVAALENIGIRHPEKLANFNQIIFAAADVDQDIMKGIGAYLIGNSGRTTSYICSSDKALATSAWLHGYARVGFLPPVFLLNEVDTVEVENTDLLNFGHSYVSTAKEILNDMFQLIQHSSPPERRFSVQPASVDGSGHWKLKD